MKTKKFLLLVMSLMTLAPMFAQSPTQVIPLRKKIHGTPPVVVPLSLDESGTFEAYIYEDILSITSTESATVYITVMSATETVSSNHVNLSAGAEYSINTEGWADGAYTLYIYSNGELWIGEFEVE